MINFDAEITKYILDTYDVIYNSDIIVSINDNSYNLEFSLNRENKPLFIGGEFDSDESFLDYIKKEIDKRRLFILKVYKIANINTYPDNELL